MMLVVQSDFKKLSITTITTFDSNSLRLKFSCWINFSDQSVCLVSK